MKFTAKYNGKEVVGLIQQPKLVGSNCSAWVVLTDASGAEVDRIMLSSAHSGGNMFDSLFKRICTTTFFKDVTQGSKVEPPVAKEESKVEKEVVEAKVDSVPVVTTEEQPKKKTTRKKK